MSCVVIGKSFTFGLCKWSSVGIVHGLQSPLSFYIPLWVEQMPASSPWINTDMIDDDASSEFNLLDSESNDLTAEKLSSRGKSLPENKFARGESDKFQNALYAIVARTT